MQQQKTIYELQKKLEEKDEEFRTLKNKDKMDKVRSFKKKDKDNEIEIKEEKDEATTGSA